MGWIRLDRAIRDNFLWNDGEPMSRGQAWIDLLLRTNFADNVSMLRGKPTLIKRGQLHTSILHLAQDWRWSRERVMRFLKVLEDEEMIKTDRTAHGTTITIEKWELYQSGDTADKTTDTTTDETTHKTTDETTDKTTDKTRYKKNNTIKRENKVKKENNIEHPYFPNDELLDEAFAKYINYRKEAKIKTTSEAIKLEMKRVQDLSGGDNDKAIAIINQTISRGWRGLFELKEDKPKTNGSIDWRNV